MTPEGPTRWYGRCLQSSGARKPAGCRARRPNVVTALYVDFSLRLRSEGNSPSVRDTVRTCQCDTTRFPAEICDGAIEQAAVDITFPI